MKMFFRSLKFLAYIGFLVLIFLPIFAQAKIPGPPSPPQVPNSGAEDLPQADSSGGEEVNETSESPTSGTPFCSGGSWFNPFDELCFDTMQACQKERDDCSCTDGFAGACIAAKESQNGPSQQSEDTGGSDSGDASDLEASEETTPRPNCRESFQEENTYVCYEIGGDCSISIAGLQGYSCKQRMLIQQNHPNADFIPGESIDLSGPLDRKEAVDHPTQSFPWCFNGWGNDQRCYQSKEFCEDMQNDHCSCPEGFEEACGVADKFFYCYDFLNDDHGPFCKPTKEKCESANAKVKEEKCPPEATDEYGESCQTYSSGCYRTTEPSNPPQPIESDSDPDYDPGPITTESEYYTGQPDALVLV